MVVLVPTFFLFHVLQECSKLLTCKVPILYADENVGKKAGGSEYSYLDLDELVDGPKKVEK